MSGANHTNETIIHPPKVLQGEPRDPDKAPEEKGHRLLVREFGDHIHVRCERVGTVPHPGREKPESRGCNANAVFNLGADANEPRAVKNADGTFTLSDAEKWLGACGCDGA